MRLHEVLCKPFEALGFVVSQALGGPGLLSEDQCFCRLLKVSFNRKIHCLDKRGCNLKQNTHPHTSTHAPDPVRVKSSKKQSGSRPPNSTRPKPLSQEKVHIVPQARYTATYKQTFMAQGHPDSRAYKNV